MSDEKIKNEINNIVQASVNWWAERITGKDGVTSEAVARFRQTLASKLKASIAITGYATLQTDYYPEGQLAEAAFETSVNGKAFPLKTFMDISLREVGVQSRHGKRQTLYAADPNLIMKY